MIKKVMICLILSLFLIGFVSAADLPNLTFSDDFKDVGNGVFIKYDAFKKPEQTLAVIEFTTHDASDYLKNDTSYGYSVHNNTNTTFNFVDEKLKEKGTIEMIEINGTKYIVESWDAIQGSNHDFTATDKNILNFNKLNNITPIGAAEAIELSNQTNEIGVKSN